VLWLSYHERVGGGNLLDEAWNEGGCHASLAGLVNGRSLATILTQHLGSISSVAADVFLKFSVEENIVTRDGHREEAPVVESTTNE
jgi:hypothetical protein